MKLLEDRVLVRRITVQDEMTEGGIVIPSTAQEAAARGSAFRGVVVAVGMGRRLKDGTNGPMAVKVEEVVTYSQFAGTQFQFSDDGEKLTCLREDEVLAVLEET